MPKITVNDGVSWANPNAPRDATRKVGVVVEGRNTSNTVLVKFQDDQILRLPLAQLILRPTQIQAERMFKLHPDTCPYCGDVSLDGGSVDIQKNGTMAEQEVTCTACGASAYIYFKISYAKLTATPTEH